MRVPVAAAEMRVTEAELLRMVARGELEGYRSGGSLLVRPAIVTRLGIRDIDTMA